MKVCVASHGTWQPPHQSRLFTYKRASTWHIKCCKMFPLCHNTSSIRFYLPQVATFPAIGPWKFPRGDISYAGRLTLLKTLKFACHALQSTSNRWTTIKPYKLPSIRYSNSITLRENYNFLTIQNGGRRRHRRLLCSASRPIKYLCVAILPFFCLCISWRYLLPPPTHSILVLFLFSLKITCFP